MDITSICRNYLHRESLSMRSFLTVLQPLNPIFLILEDLDHYWTMSQRQPLPQGPLSNHLLLLPCVEIHLHNLSTTVYRSIGVQILCKSEDLSRESFLFFSFIMVLTTCFITHDYIYGYWGPIYIHIREILRARIYSYPRIHEDPYWQWVMSDFVSSFGILSASFKIAIRDSKCCKYGGVDSCCLIHWGIRCATARID